MGCDIHAVIEREDHLAGDRKAWYNSGDPNIGRNYEMFAVLAGVRNYGSLTPIAEPRGMPSFREWHEDSDGERWASWHNREEMPCWEMETMFERYAVDGHSHSWLSLAEIKAYDTMQETARWSSVGGEPVGKRRVLTWPGETEPKSWLRLIRYMEQAKWDDQSDEEVRLVFFFDN